MDHEANLNLDVSRDAIIGGARRSTKGFTIVELLIVIVVIAILAVVTTVAYNGVQDRANYSSAQHGLSAIRKAILIYQADNGAYPSTGGSWLRYDSNGDSTVPGVVSSYIASLPKPPTTAFAGTWYYNSTGANFKLLYLTPGAGPLPSIQLTGNPLVDPNRPTRGWGYWSPGGSSF